VVFDAWQMAVFCFGAFWYITSLAIGDISHMASGGI
jgi:hypothetical protein